MITLKEAVDSIRTELTELHKESADKDVLFVVQEVELELEIQTVETKAAEIGGEMKTAGILNWALSSSLSTKGKLSKADQNSQRIRLKMSATTDRELAAVSGQVSLSAVEEHGS